MALLQWLCCNGFVASDSLQWLHCNDFVAVTLLQWTLLQWICCCNGNGNEVTTLQWFHCNYFVVISSLQELCGSVFVAKILHQWFRCNDFVGIASSQWLRDNDFVAMVFASSVCLCVKAKLPSFLMTGYTKIMIKVLR